ncbi:MAG: hypothetical protein V4649_08380 [Bacteroidota bacterium]
MKFSILVVLCIGFSLSLSAQEENDLTAEKLKGPLKSIIIRGYRGEIKNGKPRKTRALHTTTKTFNRRGFLTETTSTIGGDTVAGQGITFKSARLIYKYDDNNHLIGSTSYDANGRIKDSSIQAVDKMGNRVEWVIYKADGSRDWMYISEYDLAGNLLETNEYKREKLETRHTYRYNDQNQCNMESEYNADNRLAWKETFKYDGKGNKTEVLDFKGNGSFDARYTYKYNDIGKPVEEHEYQTEDENKYKKILTKYDNDGNVVEIVQYNENGKLDYIGKLDKYGNHLADVQYGPDGTIKQRITAEYKFDDMENETEEILVYLDGSKTVTKSSYEYDKNGNWTKKVVLEDGEVSRIVEREIVYY